MGEFIDNTLGTNIFGDNSTDKAIEAQRQATDKANATLKESYDQQVKTLNPYNEAGMSGLSGLKENDFMKNWQQDPGYQFRMSEGLKAIGAGSSAAGNLNSGRNLKALTQYGQNTASAEYDKVYGREYSRLSQLAGIGQNAASGLVNASANYGNNVSNNITGMGNATAAANIANANRQAATAGQGATAAAMYFSDARLKINVELISKEDLAELRNEMKPYRFEYKEEENGNGQWVGVMAQDLMQSKLGRTAVIQNEKGQFMIDNNKLSSLLLAMLAEG